jgi:hypothetical protein
MEFSCLAHDRGLRGGFRPVLLGAMLALLVTVAAFAAPPAPAKAPVPQQTFATADDAVAALIAAVGTSDPANILKVLGPSADKLVESGDRNADIASGKHFLESYAAQHTLVAAGTNRMVLHVGTNDWPLPLPIVQTDGRWHFDSAAGAQEIVDRRIGKNEIAAIRVSLAYVDAQQDYFARAKAAGEPGEYAQRLVSSPGDQDGLYWPQEGDDPASPLEPLVQQAMDEGYPGELVSGHAVPYQGYFFRILKRQGPEAPGGAKDYVVDGRMTGGFAMIAWPAIHRVSGIVTFLIDEDGVVYQKDLGADTAAKAAAITSFDPDLTWARVDIVDTQ